ncbi:DUF2948 family protein [Pikeienuella piscinae]|uniref:DUF2948 family protein n=1 Tax=Pikeienuella piscinae TaxID=2748098 RepID=A0A7M3T5J2_9RHOB|nr:DUF2948 family protein [Pikeienuella piscinae]QIE57273.1 DUF2948 family protein [Pikeienuella piscinae]
MGRDATFGDGGEAPLRLRAESAEDLAVISALAQDAVGKVANVHYAPRRRRFSVLVYRFRWEDRDRAEREKRAYERVAAALTFDDVLRARAAGLDPREKSAVFNILGIDFQPGEECGGMITLTCSGGAAVQMQVECVNVALVDLTRPWAAGGQPQHF